MAAFAIKEILAPNTFDIFMEKFIQFLSRSSTPLPCIYCFSLGTVKNLRKGINISNDVPDDHIVIKCGYTDDLKRRMSEYRKIYESIGEFCEIELLRYARIDVHCSSMTETEIKFYLKSNAKQIFYEKYKEELFTYNPLQKKDIIKYFDKMAKKYSGCLKDINKRYDQEKQSLETQIADLKRKIELQDAIHKNKTTQLRNEIGSTM